MAYTKAKLIEAFCEAQNCKKSDLADIKTRMQSHIDVERARVQERLDNIPNKAIDRMKQIALKHLSEKAAKQAIEDNAGVDLD